MLCVINVVVSRYNDITCREMDILYKFGKFQGNFSVADYEQFSSVGVAVSYHDQQLVEPHQHYEAQLLYAIQGIMVVGSNFGQWVVPPTRGLWLPAHFEHWIRMVGSVELRTVFIPSLEQGQMPQHCCVLHISALLRELILATMHIPHDYLADSRHARLIQVLIDELIHEPVLPLHLPMPRHTVIQHICQRTIDQPDQTLTVEQWANQFCIHPKTLFRLFRKETGMTYGQWRQQANLLKALELLAQGHKVIDVALELGYSSPSAFSAMFKKMLGKMPSEFLNRK